MTTTLNLNQDANQQDRFKCPPSYLSLKVCVEEHPNIRDKLLITTPRNISTSPTNISTSHLAGRITKKALIPLIAATAILYSALIAFIITAVQHASLSAALTITLQGFGLAALGTVLGPIILYGIPALILIASIIVICKNRSHQPQCERISPTTIQDKLDYCWNFIHLSEELPKELSLAIRRCDLDKVRELLPIFIGEDGQQKIRTKKFNTYLETILEIITSIWNDPISSYLVDQYSKMAIIPFLQERIYP